MTTTAQETKQLESARKVLAHLAETLDIPISVKLWDGSITSLGKTEANPHTLVINGSKTISTLIKKPGLDNLLRHYAVGKIDFSGSDLVSFMDHARNNSPKKKTKQIKKSLIFKEAIPFLFGPTEAPKIENEFGDDEIGEKEGRENSDYIQFHYDVSNDFYKLFLDPEMQYSCAYFKDENTSLAQAQIDKLEHTCRKLRLKEGETLLDIGSGWGGLICYAAKNFGVKAHGVTLSKEQLALTQEKIKREGLEGKVTVALCDYMNVEGVYDKVVSVGMFEHVGRKNIPRYFSKMNKLVKSGGIFLNHAITRKAKKTEKQFDQVRPERRLLQKYIFPGMGLDHIGHSVTSMERHGFEVRDVECLREHYAMTLWAWAKNLEAKKDDAIRYVGVEKYRLWLAYLAAVSFGFKDGNTGIYQTVAVKRGKKGFARFPLTREDLYR